MNEVKAMIKYVYPERKEEERQDYQRGNKPVIHNNVSSYAQVLANFHDDTPVPTNNSNKRLKIQFREQTPTSKRDAPKEVTFIDTDEPTPAEDLYGMQTVTGNRNPTPKEGIGYVAGYNKGGRGGQGGNGYAAGRNHATSNTVQLPNPWRNEVHSMISEMKVDIMKEITSAISTTISTQLSEIAKAMAAEITAALNVDLSALIKKAMNPSPIELEEEFEPITQTPTKNNDNSTPMEIEADQRKRKMNTDNENSEEPNMITPARNLRPQRSRGIANTTKKTLKEGQKVD